MRQIRKRIFLGSLLLISLVVLTGCSSKEPEEETSALEPQQLVISGDNRALKDSSQEILQFVDAHGQSYETVIDDAVEKHPYDWQYLNREGNILSYEDDQYASRWGIDVSEYNGSIDWAEAKNAGVSFAFVRIGYRGYGDEGALGEDAYGIVNINAAQEAGIDTGVYFFSQAIDETEAVEEAEYVLSILNGTTLSLPVVYDVESILDDDARTDEVSGEQFTDNAISFCNRIQEGGYETMIYSNMVWEAFEWDLPRLNDREIWYADYEPEPQTPYHFTFWQYAENSEIENLSGTYDLDIQIYKKNQGGND